MLPEDAQVLFDNRVGCIYQSPSARRFYLEFQGVLQSFSAPQFGQLRAKMSSISPESLLLNHSLCDTEVLYIPSMDVLIVMRVHELLGLKDLFSGASAMQDLTSILYQRIYNVLC